VVDPTRAEAADALVTAGGALLAIAIRSVGAGAVPLTVAQHRVLVLVESHRAVTVNELAEHLGVDQSNASRHCSRLATLGLVTRTRARHDGRAVDVRVTPSGRRQVRAVRAARRLEIRQVLDRMSDRSVRESVRGFTAFDEAAAHAPVRSDRTRPGPDLTGTATPGGPVSGSRGHDARSLGYGPPVTREESTVPSKSANVKNEKQYEALKDKGMSKERAAKIANSPGASSRGGKKSGSGGDSSQGGTTAQKKKAGRKGGQAAAKKS
jgi:DNA-binding MarR family transcriptional regulator